MRLHPAAGLVLAVPVLAWPSWARAEDEHEAVRGLALADLPDPSTVAQLEVGTSLTSVGGVLGAQTALGLGLGRGFVLEASGQMREDSAAPQMERSGDVGASLGFRWGRRWISQVKLGACQGLGASVERRVRGGAAIRSTGASWVAAALELGVGDLVEGSLAAAVGGGRGPIVPALEARIGRCAEATCALGAAGVRVRLPAAFELGLSLIAEAAPARQVGMGLSFVWTSQPAKGD